MSHDVETAKLIGCRGFTFAAHSLTGELGTYPLLLFGTATNHLTLLKTQADEERHRIKPSQSDAEAFQSGQQQQQLWTNLNTALVNATLIVSDDCISLAPGEE